MTDMNVNSAAPSVLPSAVNSDDNQEAVKQKGENPSANVKSNSQTAGDADATAKTFFGTMQESISSGLSAAQKTVSDGVDTMHAQVSSLTEQAQQALSYEGLSRIGRESAETVGNFVNSNTATPRQVVQDWANWSAEKITDSANTAGTFSVNNYAPIAMFALGAFTAKVSLQRGFTNAQAAYTAQTKNQGNTLSLAGRAAVQILVGSAAAALAGSIAFASPAGQTAYETVSGLFQS